MHSKLFILALGAACPLLAAEAHLIECRPPENATKDAHGLYTGTYFVDGVAKGSCVTASSKGSAVYVHYLEAAPPEKTKPCPPGKPRLGCAPAGSVGPYVPTQREYDAQLQPGQAGGPPGGPGPARPCAPGTTWNGQSCVGTPVGQPATLSPADAALLSGIRIVKAPNGSWKCTTVSGKICSDAQAAHVVTKSRSNVKDNLLSIAPDGTLSCLRPSDGKACSDTGMLDAVERIKAITKGGQSGF
jgi:hypothetical protein